MWRYGSMRQMTFAQTSSKLPNKIPITTLKGETP